MSARKIFTNVVMTMSGMILNKFVMALALHDSKSLPNFSLS